MTSLTQSSLDLASLAQYEQINSLMLLDQLLVELVFEGLQGSLGSLGLSGDGDALGLIARSELDEVFEIVIVDVVYA